MAAIGIHHPDLPRSRPVADEDDLRTVGRPGRVEVEVGVIGQLDEARPIDADAVDVVGPLRDAGVEGDLSPSGEIVRERREPAEVGDLVRCVPFAFIVQISKTPVRCCRT